MAERHPRGWLWTDKEPLPEGLEALKRKSETVRIQLARFASALPDLAAEAQAVGGALLESTKPLVALWTARKNKFLPLSPEEAISAFQKARLAEEAWLTFMRRNDVQAGIGGVNREVRAQKRQIRQTVTGALSQAQATLETPAFREHLRESVERNLEIAVAGATLMWGAGANEHSALIRRFVTIQFVRLSFAESAPRMIRLTAFLRRTPPPSIHEVVTEASMNVVRDELVSIGGGRALFAGRGKAIEACVGLAAGALQGSVRKWREEGNGPERIGVGCFEILGFDYGLKAHPE